MTWVRCLDQEGRLVVINLDNVASVTDLDGSQIVTYVSGGTQAITAMFDDLHSSPMAACKAHDSPRYGTDENPIMILPYG